MLNSQRFLWGKVRTNCCTLPRRRHQSGDEKEKEFRKTAVQGAPALPQGPVERWLGAIGVDPPHNNNKSFPIHLRRTIHFQEKFERVQVPTTVLQYSSPSVRRRRRSVFTEHKGRLREWLGFH